MPLPSAFPPEIYDKIIDEISSSKSSLSACSLVESSWIPRSRTHMFRNVDFKICSTNSSMTTGLSRSIEHTAAFQQSIASNTDVASYARQLVLTLTSSGNIASEIPHASNLRNLRSLTLKCSNVIIYAVNDAILTRLLSFVRHNQRLEYISVQSVILDPSAFDVFMVCIAIRAPCLRSLHLYSIWGPDWTTNTWNSQKFAQRSQSCPKKARSLSRLCISHCEDGAVLAFLSAFDLPYLERIALMNLDWGSCMAMTVATFNSPSLTHFTLDLSYHGRLLINDSEEQMFDRLASIPTVQLVLKHFNDAPCVLQHLQRAAFRRKPSLERLHLEFRRYPSTANTMMPMDVAFRELHSVIPSLRVSIGSEIQEGIRGTGVAMTAPLFRQMGQTEVLQFKPLDDWWSTEAEGYERT